MAYIKENWDKKKTNIEKAKTHTDLMSDKYYKEITHSIECTTLYDTDFEYEGTPKSKPTSIEILDMDTVQAAASYQGLGKTAVLNFASYKTPGGMFLEGSNAQEECLCHASFLYNVLKVFQNYYEWNNAHKNKGLYLNRALYSPDVIFTYEGKPFRSDVITCAAPNKSTAMTYMNVSERENYISLLSRIEFILDIAADNNADTLIVGAYGCGVFGQNPTEVANIFKKFLDSTHKNCFKQVVFAIPEGKNENLSSFKSVFGEINNTLKL